MTTATTTVEIFVLVDSAGDSAVGVCEQSAREAYEEHVQPLADCDGFRLTKVLLTVPLPEVSTVELTATAPTLAPASALFE